MQPLVFPWHFITFITLTLHIAYELALGKKKILGNGMRIVRTAALRDLTVLFTKMNTWLNMSVKM